MKILFRDFNAKVHSEDFFKPKIGKERFHKINHHNGDRTVNFAIYKNLTVKGTMFPHYNIMLLGCLLMEKLNNQIDHILPYL
jgi:hypothetical protein